MGCYSFNIIKCWRIAVQNLKMRHQTWTVDNLIYQLLLGEWNHHICHCRINFVNQFQLCVVIYSALIVWHNLEALGKGCGLFNINQNVSIYQRHCLKVRVWSTLNKILTLSQIHFFFFLFTLNKNLTPCLEQTIEYQVRWNQSGIFPWICSWPL